MKHSFSALLMFACLGSLASAAYAQAPAGAPAGATVQCNDGTFASPEKKAGACRAHKGIKVWFGPDAAAPAAKAAPAAAAPATKTTKNALPAEPAPGGGSGKVWANDESKVYHCPGDRYYGKTKKGEYMTEAEAKAKGMHAARNKACS
jgi:hypothetical protein